MGYMCISSTFPTGYDTLSCSEMPNSDPATAIWYSGACSQKYFSDSIASGMSWTSSRMTSVSPGVISTDVIAFKPRSILSTSKSLAKILLANSFFRHITYASLLYSLLANSRRTHVFPTCRAPFRISGFRSSLFFHNTSSCNTVLSMYYLTFFCI